MLDAQASTPRGHQVATPTAFSQAWAINACPHIGRLPAKRSRDRPMLAAICGNLTGPQMATSQVPPFVIRKPLQRVAKPEQ